MVLSLQWILTAACHDRPYQNDFIHFIRRAGQRAISPLPSLGANPCKPMWGKPTVATVPPNCADRLDKMGNCQTEQGEIHFSARRCLLDLRKRNFLLRRDSCLKLRLLSPALLVSDAFCITHLSPARQDGHSFQKERSCRNVSTLLAAARLAFDVNKTVIV
jgi:hypothetical protein